MPLQEDDINRILVEELGKMGAIGMSGGAAGARFSAKRLATDSYQTTIQPELSNAALVKIVKRHFNYQKPENVEGDRLLFRRTVGSGFFNMNPTLLFAIVDGQAVHLVAYAKEGLLQQHSAQKAVEAFAKVLQAA